MPGFQGATSSYGSGSMRSTRRGVNFQSANSGPGSFRASRRMSGTSIALSDAATSGPASGIHGERQGRHSDRSPPRSPLHATNSSIPRRRQSLAPPDFFEGEETSANVKVFLRVRPFNKRELRISEEQQDGYLRSVVEMPEGPNGTVNLLEKLPGDDDEYVCKEQFSFDRILWSIPEEQQPLDGAEFATQDTVFEHVGKPALENAWKGYNTCIFAYGQTGAGKTHTMMGHFLSDGGVLQGDPGVIPQVCRALYTEIEDKRAQQEESGKTRLTKITYETELSAYEIYNERVRDLFYMFHPGRQPKDELKVRKHPLEGPFVDQISKLTPSTWMECVEKIELGNAQRSVGSTNMNAESSRSHSVFQIKFSIVETSIPQEKFEKPVTNRKYSILNLIDLAGSERNKKSGAEGERLVEATNINLSLTTLKRVIDALVFNSQHQRTQHKQVPYRDSVLTLLLSHSLGGNSKTMMVATVSPHHDNAEETHNTLRYASAARKIVNIVHSNQDAKARENLLLKEKMEAMKEQLAAAMSGEADPAMMEELRDQIAVGQRELERNLEKMQRIEEEKQLEKERRYHAAFQHSFQMVILRRQKEAAQKIADEVDHYKAEAATAGELKRRGSLLRRERDEVEREKQNAEEYATLLKEQLETTKKEHEQILEKAYGIRWIEQHKAAHAQMVTSKQIDKLQQKHKREMEEIVYEAGEAYDSLTQAHSDREGELRARIEALQKENNALRKFNSTHEQQVVSLQEKADEWKMQSLRKDSEWKAKLEEAAKSHRETISSQRSRADRRIAELEDEVARVKVRARQSEASVRDAAEQRVAELERLAETRVRNVRSEHQRELDRVRENATRELGYERDKHREGLEASERGRRDEAEQQVSVVTEKLQRAEERIEQQRRLLVEVKHREERYRDLAREVQMLLESAKHAGHGESTQLQEFLIKAREFHQEYHSHPINRDAVKHASRAPNGVHSADSPLIAAQDEDAGTPRRPYTASTSPARRQKRSAWTGLASPR